MIQRNYGWKKQKVDARDYKLERLGTIRKLAPTIPPATDLRQWDSPIKDQSTLGSCTAHSLTGVLQFNQIKFPRSGSNYQDLSRLFIYYQERAIENTIDEDAGAEIRDGIKALAKLGVPPEQDWPYNIFQFATNPPSQSYVDALTNVIHSYYSLDGATPNETLTNVKTALANGEPVAFGFNVYDSFESDAVASSGLMPVPNVQTESLQGGHAVMCLGYDDAKGWLIVRNSWGASWGDKGYFYMPYAVILGGMASDFWVIVKDV